jgi:hypothetical protein
VDRHGVRPGVRQQHSYIVAFWVGAAILTAAELAVAPLLRRSAAEITAEITPKSRPAAHQPASS